MSVVAPFSVLELVGLVVSIIGLIPVLSQHKEETKWFTAGYVLLVVGMIATNLEAVVLPIILNFTEHGIGIGLAGVTFFAAAYSRKRDLVEGGS